MKRIALFLFSITVAVVAVVGCSTLDKLSPQYAGHPAIKATTQPGSTTKPAEGRDVPAQLADVGQQVGPLLAAVPVPLAGLIGGIITLLSTTVLSIDQSIRRAKHLADKNDLQAQLDEAISTPAGTKDDPVHTVIIPQVQGTKS